jgi:DNA repair protein RadD
MITLASRDSLGNNPEACGQFDLVIVDEAHLVPIKDESVYGRVFNSIDPKYIVGFTGTPWRLDCGLICGKNGFFDQASANIPMRLLINQGFLSPYIFPDTKKTVIKTDGIKMLGGEFNKKQLTEVSSADAIVSDCIDLWETEAQERKCSIFFCCSLAHAAVVVEGLEKRGKRVAYLDGATDQKRREYLFNSIRAGHFECIVNVEVLTTGVDFPLIDCVVMLRATQSASLFVQAFGRGLRISPGKENCLFLDLTDNFQRFESIEKPMISFKGTRKTRQRQCLPDGNAEKTCPNCSEKTPSGNTVCHACNHVFFSHGVTAFGGTPIWHEVSETIVRPAFTKTREPCFIVEYQLKKGKSVRQWILHKRKWAGEGRKALARLKISGAWFIQVDNLMAQYPKVIKTVYKDV